MKTFTINCHLIEKYNAEITLQADNEFQAKEIVKTMALEGVSSDETGEFDWDYYGSEFEVIETNEVK